MTTIVFWLMIQTGTAHAPPVFLPEPFVSEADCVNAGNVFKDSPLDGLEAGKFTCIPQTKAEPTP